jgi:hypothetical protein
MSMQMAPVDTWGGVANTLNQWNQEREQARQQEPLRQMQAMQAQQLKQQMEAQQRVQGFIAKADAAKDPNEKLYWFAQASPDTAMQLHGKTLEQQVALVSDFGKQAALNGDSTGYMTALKVQKALVDKGDPFSFSPQQPTVQQPTVQQPTTQQPTTQQPTAQLPTAQQPTEANPFGLPNLSMQKKVANTVKVYDKLGTEHKLGLDSFGNPIKLDTGELPKDFNYKSYSETAPSRVEAKFVDPKTKDSYMLSYDKSYPEAPRTWLKGGRPISEDKVPQSIRSESVGNTEARVTVIDPWNRAAANSWGNIQTNAEKMRQEGKYVGEYDTHGGRHVAVSKGAIVPTNTTGSAGSGGTTTSPSSALNLPPAQVAIYSKVDSNLDKATAPLKDANFQIDRLTEILKQNNPATIGNVSLDKARLFSGTLASTRVQMAKYLASAEAGDRSAYQRGVQAIETLKNGKVSQTNIDELRSAVSELKKIYAKYTLSTIRGIADNAINIPEVAKKRLKEKYFGIVSGGDTTVSGGSSGATYKSTSGKTFVLPH